MTIKATQKDVYRLDYDLKDAIYLTFKTFAFYPVVQSDAEAKKLNSNFREDAMAKYGNCGLVKPAIFELKYARN